MIEKLHPVGSLVKYRRGPDSFVYAVVIRVGMERS